MTKRQRTPIADSPWLWFALFTGVGMVFLLITGGRFGRRQAKIERHYQAREWIRAKKARGEWTEEQATAAESALDEGPKKSSVAVPNYSTAGNTLIRVRPLEITFGILCAFCIGMFVRERRRQWGDCHAVEPPAGPMP